MKVYVLEPINNIEICEYLKEGYDDTGISYKIKNIFNWLKVENII